MPIELNLVLIFIFFSIKDHKNAFYMLVTYLLSCSKIICGVVKYFNFISFLTQENIAIVLGGFSVILYLFHMLFTFCDPYSFDYISLWLTYLLLNYVLQICLKVCRYTVSQLFVWQSSSLRTLKIVFYLISSLVDVEKSGFAFLKVIMYFLSGCLSSLCIVNVLRYWDIFKLGLDLFLLIFY